MSDPTMHIYAKTRWHDEAVIAGNAQALRSLRDAIDSAIKFGAASALSFTDDGEGYRVCVCVHEMHGDPLPYTDTVARGTEALVKCSPDLQRKIADATRRSAPDASR